MRILFCGIICLVLMQGCYTALNLREHPKIYINYENKKIRPQDVLDDSLSIDENMIGIWERRIDLNDNSPDYERFFFYGNGEFDFISERMKRYPGIWGTKSDILEILFAHEKYVEFYKYKITGNSLFTKKLEKNSDFKITALEKRNDKLTWKRKIIKNF